MQLVQNHTENYVRLQDVLPDVMLPKTAAFKVWQAIPDVGMSLTVIAEKLDVTVSSVSIMLNSDRISTARHSDLVRAGIPSVFLPRIEDVKSGPKPKTKPE